MVLYTVGHSNLALAQFAANLLPHGVELVVDVRTTPRSRFAPWSSGPRAAERLAEHGLDYLYMGDALGGRPPIAVDPDSAIDNLLALAAERRVAVMCSEGDPMQCHREHLIGRLVRARSVPVAHILRDGTLTPPRLDL